MIVTLTLNPALDKSTEVERLIPEKKMRCAEMKIEAGGGGINISKALKELGSESTAIFPSGGLNGQQLEKLLKQMKVSFRSFPVPGETRESFMATETSTNKQFRFILPGPELDPSTLQQIIALVEELAPSFLICSGSMPPGVPDTFPGDLAAFAKKKGIKLIVDTSGPALKEAAGKGVFLLKPNLSELSFLVGKDYLELSDIDEAAAQVLRESGCAAVIASMGPSGAMLVTHDLTRRIVAPQVRKLSTVGAGDSMVAGLVWMLEKGASIEEAAVFGVACGTAATMNKGTQLFKKEDAFRLYDYMAAKK